MPIFPNYDMYDILPEQSDISAGEYHAELKQVRERISERRNLPILAWFWEIKQGRFKGREMVSFTDNGTKVNHDLMIDALLNHLQALGYKGEKSVNIADYIGKQAILAVVLRKRKGSKGRAYPFVDRILPLDAAH